ncbi:MAG: PglZ domain-containing protein, partial [Dehalococcoidia bacterium]
AAADNWIAGKQFLATSAPRIAVGMQSRWNREGDGGHWSLLNDLSSLCRQAALAAEASTTLGSAADMVKAYAGEWSRIDRLHLGVREIYSQYPGLEAVRELADRAYFEYVAAVNDRFAELVEVEQTWPPSGAVGVAALRATVWEGERERKAVIVSDALRWDLGQQVAEQVGDGCKVSPVISTLPSITPFGMTAMLPLREGEPQVKWAGGPTIKDRAGHSLAERSGRRGLIEEVLKSQGRTVSFVEMTALLRSKKAPAGDLVLVFDTNIDSQGHKAVENLPAVARKLVADIRRSIEKLHASAISTVHVLTDHGFLLLEPEHVRSLGQPEAAIIQFTKRESRWGALKPDATAEGLIRLPLPLAPEAGALGLPRGVRTLESPEPYMHGGLSLQECVIPHLVAVAAMPVATVLPSLGVAAPRLTGGTVAFTLKPAPLQKVPLAGIRPRAVRLLLETAADPPLSLAAAKEEELRQEMPEIKGAIYIEEGLNLSAGASLRLRCLDRDTGEELASVSLTLAVDWE